MRPWHRTTDHANGRALEQGPVHASMRPWHRTTDHVPEYFDIARRRIASMRPWHRTTDYGFGWFWMGPSNGSFNEAVAQNHGSPDGYQCSRIDRNASMRPWHRTTDHNREQPSLSRPLDGFNEAVAQNHGSLRSLLLCSAGNSRFNEAVAQNHGSRRVVVIPFNVTLASMRPWHRTTDHFEIELKSRFLTQLQ